MTTSASERVDLDQAFLRSAMPPARIASGAEIGIVDLFSGCGGLTVGAIEGARRCGRPAGLQLAVDLWTDALEVLELSVGVEDERLMELDLSQVLAGVAEADRSTEGRIKELGAGAQLLLAGPPCQGHSALNNHTRHDDPRNDLYLAVARVARLIEPDVVIIENVRGIGTDKRRSLEHCQAALEELDYEVVDRLLNLHDFGAAQTRIRHVLVAGKGRRFDFDEIEAVPGRTVEWAIGDLVRLDGRTLFDTASVPSPLNRRRMQWLMDHPDRYDLPNSKRPRCHQTDHSYRAMYGQLRWDRPAQTITSGFGSMGQGRFVHPAGPRTLTPHEAARLQFLPDFMNFGLLEQRTQMATMIGNAAPPILTIVLVSALIDQGLL